MEDYSDRLHAFLKQIKKEQVDESQIEILIDIVSHLERNTKKQITRFITYYCSKDQVTLAIMAREEGCTVNAIRCSIVRVTFSLVKLNDYRKDILIKIMNNVMKSYLP